MSETPGCNQTSDYLLRDPEYQRMIEKIALKYTKGTSISWQDAAQTAHFKVFQVLKAGHFCHRGVRDFYYWSATVARFEIIDFIRRHKYQNWQSLDQKIPGTDLSLLDTIPDQFNMIDAVERADLVDRALDAITALDDRYPSRGYLKLWQGKVQGKTETQLAAELGVSQGAISKRLNKELPKRIAEELGLLQVIDIHRQQHRYRNQKTQQKQSQTQCY
ncbi:MAG TPA: sigma-70 family RNA polymerase sigma factor [Stenomitos sp.]